MAYTNSPLVTYTKLTSNHSGQRKHIIDTITIHCIVGQWTAKQGCDYFANTDRQCSANYVVGKDGSIGLSVEEKNRSWCSGGTDKYGNPIRVNGISGADNDHRAITIEVASDTTHPYAVTDQAYNALVRLVADICKRNGIKKLLWKGDKSLVGKVSEQNMTVHRWFAQKACPGDYLYNRHAQIAAEVNKLLGNASDTPAPPKPPAQKTLYRVRKSWSDTKSQLGAFSILANAKSLVDKNPGYKVFDESGKVVYEKGGTSTASVPYIVRVTATDLYIRRGAGTNYGANGFIKPGVYTIVEEQDGQGATKWGKLKSGAGWISLDFVQKL